MAVMATEYADQTVHKELVNHAKIFEKRSLDLQSELYKEYPKEAMEITLTEFTVWDITICPLDCAYNNDMYEFISDPCSQRCLNKIWYNELGTNINALKMGFTCRQIYGRHAVCRLLSAPFTKFVINYLVFFVGILLYSAFLLTNVRTIDNIGGFEIFVYVWMLSDMAEEYLVPIYYRKQKTSGWSDKWYRFGRYINNFWNALDTLSYLLTFMAIGLRFTEVTLLWARRIYSFSLFLMFMRFLHFVLINRKVGVYVILIKEMMRDLARFIVILIVFMLAIGVMYHVNKYPNHHDMWPPEIEKWRIWQIIYLHYWKIYGELMLEQVTGNKNPNSTCTYIDREHESNIDRCEVSDDWVLFVIAAFYMLLSNLLLVNLVIALFS